jgi:hypothetical protein
MMATRRRRRQVFTCCLCGMPSLGWPNDAWPLVEGGKCCERCDREKVLPARIEMAYPVKEREEKS